MKTCRVPFMFDDPDFRALSDGECGFVIGLLVSRTPRVFVGSLRSYASHLQRPYPAVQRIAVALKDKGLIDYDESVGLIAIRAPFLMGAS